jgi:NAD(P)-dependent dehydrogenase (short-subunit alcohol dehydrogenase family)
MTEDKGDDDAAAGAGDGLLAGKVVIVAGVGAGLGRQIAVRAAAEGAAVVLGARTEPYLAEVAAEIAAAGGRAAYGRCDITDDGDCARLVALAVEQFGGVDCVVANAFAVGPLDEPIEQADLDGWNGVFGVTVAGSLKMARASLGALRRRGGGSIVFVGSQIVRRVRPGRAAYAASKAALLSAAQVLAREVGADGIRVNTVLPGAMDGPPLRAAFERRAAAAGTTPEAEYQSRAAPIALGRIPTDAECAGPVLFLASDLSCAMTGQSVDVNGGEIFT